MLEWKTDEGAVMLVCGVDDVSQPGFEGKGLRFANCGTLCREMARELPLGSKVLIGEGVEDVSPLNLAAAVKHDRSDVGVLVTASSFGGSMASRASSAGVDLLVSPREAREQVRMWGTMPAASPQLVAGGANRSMTVCFVSGRGGVGKSTMSVFFALAAHDAGLRTALVDMDLQFGDLAYLCADDSLFEKVPLGAMHAPSDHGGSSDAAIPLFHVDALPEYADPADVRFGEFLLEAKSSFDVILINMGTHWTDLHADVVGASDLAVFVMDQRLSSVISCRDAMNLAMRLGAPSSKLAFLLNRCDPREQISGYDCALALGVDDILQVNEGGRDVEDAFALASPSSLRGTRNPAFESASLVARGLYARFGFPVDAAQGGASSKSARRRGGKAKRGE